MPKPYREIIERNTLHNIKTNKDDIKINIRSHYIIHSFHSNVPCNSSPDNDLLYGVDGVVNNIPSFVNDAESSGCDEFHFFKIGFVPAAKE